MLCSRVVVDGCLRCFCRVEYRARIDIDVCYALPPPPLFSAPSHFGFETSLNVILRNSVSCAMRAHGAAGFLRPRQGMVNAFGKKYKSGVVSLEFALLTRT